MRLHRFFIRHNITPGQAVFIQDPEIITQVRQVLRLKAGHEIIVCDPEGKEAVAVIEKFKKDEMVLQLFDVKKESLESSKKVTLYCAIAKRENFEWVCQKATEVGVTKIVPIITARTVKLNIKPERVKKIIQEAAEQSGRTQIPELTLPIEFAEAINLANQHQKNIIFEKDGEPIEQILKNNTIQGLGIFVGPEGGWEAGELMQAQEHKFVRASLGRLTLRTETAAIIACYLVCQ